MDREAWRAAIHRVTKSQIRLSDWIEWNKSYLLLVTLEILGTPNSSLGVPGCHHTLTCLGFCPQSLKASESFSNESTLHMMWPKYWSFNFSIIPSKISQSWSLSEWTFWISLQSKGLTRVSPTPQFKSINSLALSFAQGLSTPLSWPFLKHSLEWYLYPSLN